MDRRRSDSGDDCPAEGGGRKLVYLAIAGGAAVVIAGASLLRRWWLRRSDRKTGGTDSPSAARISDEDEVRAQMVSSTDIVLFRRETEDEESVPFDGLTVVVPSMLLSQVFEFIKDLGTHSNYSVETSNESGQNLVLVVCDESGLHNEKKIKLICASSESNDAGKRYFYKNGAVIIEELDSDDTHMTSSEQSILEEGRVILKNSGTTVNGNKERLISATSEMISSNFRAVIDSRYFDLTSASQGIQIALTAQPGTSIIFKEFGRLTTSPSNLLEISSSRANLENKESKADVSCDEVASVQAESARAAGRKEVVKRFELAIAVQTVHGEDVIKKEEEKENNKVIAQPGSIHVSAPNWSAPDFIPVPAPLELPVPVKSVDEEVELDNGRDAKKINNEDLQQEIAQPRRCHVSAPNWPVLELLPVPELVHEERRQLASRPQQVLEVSSPIAMTVGAETEIKGNIAKSENERSNEEMEEAQAELAKIEKDTNESKALELFSSDGAEVRAKTEADESILSSETEKPQAEMERIPTNADESMESNREKEKKKKKKKKNKKNNNNNKGIDGLGQPTDANLEISSLAIQVPKENKKCMEKERDDPSVETEKVSEKQELGMAAEKKKKKKKNNKGMEWLGQEHTQLCQLSEAKMEISSLSAVHEITAESAMAAQIQSKKPNEEAKILIKKKREKKKDKKKKSKANTAAVSFEQAPKVMGGFKQVGPALSCHLATPYRAEKNILKGNGLSHEAPNHQEKSYAGLKGMKNLGNTCFMNSILQCLSHCEPLIEKLEMIDHAKPCSSKGFCYVCELKEIINDIHRGKKAVISPVNFRDDLSSLMSGFLPGQQADAQEYLHRFLDKLGGPSEAFCGFSTNLFRCCRCDTSRDSESFFPFNHLSLDVSTATTLSDALKAYTSASTAEDYRFEGCSCSARVEKTELLAWLPDVLVVHLKRYQYDTRGRATRKVGHQVEYPAQLDLATYMSCSIAGQQTKYELTSVVEHQGGSGESGHYVSIIRQDSSWFMCNDSEVIRITSKEALTKCAYLLIYMKHN